MTTKTTAILALLLAPLVALAALLLDGALEDPAAPDEAMVEDRDSASKGTAAGGGAPSGEGQTRTSAPVPGQEAESPIVPPVRRVIPETPDLAEPKSAASAKDAEAGQDGAKKSKAETDKTKSGSAGP